MNQAFIYGLIFIFVVLVWLGMWNLFDSWRIRLFGEKNFGNYLAVAIGLAGILIIFSLTGIV